MDTLADIRIVLLMSWYPIEPVTLCNGVQQDVDEVSGIDGDILNVSQDYWVCPEAL